MPAQYPTHGFSGDKRVAPLTQRQTGGTFDGAFDGRPLTGRRGAPLTGGFGRIPPPPSAPCYSPEPPTSTAPLEETILPPRQPHLTSLGIVLALAAATAAPADIVIDLGRGPVTVNVPPSYDPARPAPLRRP